MRFPNGTELVIEDTHNNGIVFEGTKGRIEVNRGSLKGKAAKELKTNPLASDTITKLYKGKKPGDHMGNFFECIKTHEAADLGRLYAPPGDHDVPPGKYRSETWTDDPLGPCGRRMIVGDPEAKTFQSRERRKGFEIKVSAGVGPAISARRASNSRRSACRTTRAVRASPSPDSAGSDTV